MKLYCLLNQATEILTQSQIPTPRLDAEVLMSHLLGIERVQLYVQPDRKMSESERLQFKKLIERRMAGEPVSYIRGLKEFWSLLFRVGPGVMVPRPDTEVLIEAILSKIPLRGDLHLHILDIGTGSGNIAITLAKEFPDAKITAIDISEEALVFARENAKINKVEDQIVFLQEDFLNWNRVGATGRSPLQNPFDLIVSNPPYISSAVIETLDLGIRSFEPRMALDGGADGLDFYRRMGDTLPSLLKPGGMIAVEIGEDQAEAVVGIFERAGLSEMEVVNDYSGLSRVVLGKRQ